MFSCVLYFKSSNIQCNVQDIISGCSNIEKLAVTQEAQKYAQHVRYQAILVLIEALDLESLLYMVYDNVPFRWIEMHPLYYLVCVFVVFNESFCQETTQFSYLELSVVLLVSDQRSSF